MRQFVLPLLCVLVTLVPVFGQKPAVIKVKKTSLPFLFFNKNTTHDTIYPNKSDCFYLLMPDSLKPLLEIETINAQLSAQQNDSTVLLHYMPGINYLQKYVMAESETGKPNENKPRQLITMIDGANQTDRKKMQIVFRNKGNNSVFARFIYLAP